MNAGMRAEDFEPCAACGKGVAHARVPLFYRVRVETMWIDARAVGRTDAMERYMGGAVALARVFEDPEIAKPIEGTERVFLLCQPCALKDPAVMMLVIGAS